MFDSTRFDGARCSPYDRARRLALIFGLVCLGLSGWASASAQDLALAPKPLTQYHHDVWQTQHGLPSNGLRAALQTRDGYLWFGAEAGLVRFDGVSFTTFDRNSTPALKATDVTALFEDRSGTLWVGTEEGSVFRRERGEFIDVSPSRRLRGAITTFHQDQAGGLWVAGGDEVARIEGQIFASLPPAPGIVHALREDQRRTLWLGTSLGLARVDGDHLTVPDPPGPGVQAFCRDLLSTLWMGTRAGLVKVSGTRERRFTTRDGLPSDDVRVVIPDRWDGIWIGTTAGLARLQNDRITSFTIREGLSDGWITALTQDVEGSVWVATHSGGLNRLRPVPFSSITKRQGLVDDDVLAVFEDHDGQLWVGTDGSGLTLLTNEGRDHYTLTVDEGLPSNVIYAVNESSDGAVWVGTARGLARVYRGRVTSFAGKPEFPQGAIRAILEDHAGNLWVGNRNGLHRLRGGTTTTYTRADGMSSNNVTVIREDHEGTLWIGTLEGGLHRFKGGKFSVYTVAQGLTSNDVSAILTDGQYVWVGTLDGNLHLIRSDRALALPPRDGVSAGRVLQILDDARGSLWVSGQRGITRYERGDLLKVAGGTREAATTIAYDHSDGFGRWEFHGPSQSSGVRRRNGVLVFASAAGAIVVDPSKFIRTLAPPPVHIERIVSDGREMPIGQGMALPAGQNQLEFHYTALSYSVPGRVKFKYQLEGVDPGWIDAGARRVAYYTNVPGGSYRFRVIAANSDGAWNQQGATLALTVGSRFWETNWFYGVAVLGLVFGVAGLSRLRVRRLQARERMLERIVDERTAALSGEVNERKRVEESLRKSRDELEDRVRERTTELSVAYAQLQQDVAQRRKLEEQLAQVQKLESIGRLAGGVAHDINNVLTVVLSYSDLVEAGLGPGHPLQAQLRQIRKAAERASNLTHRLLAFARKQIIEPRVINLSDLSLNLDGMLRRLIGEDVELITMSSANLWSVKADPHQIEQVLVNLAVNARDAMPQGGRLSIETANVTIDEAFARQHPTLRVGEYVRLTVSDTGIGISDEVRKHLFEPFFTTKEPGKGTGLGLATCYGIVQQLGGVIYPETEVGRGTVFNVFVPRIDLPADPTPKPQESFVKRGTETVLLVEDEPLVREIARSALGDQGYHVIEAEHGEAALRVARQYTGTIGLVLTDVVMPKMGGRELVEALKKERPAVRVLYMSGYAASTIDETDVIEPGTSFLRKPFALAEMLRKVREVLDEGTPGHASGAHRVAPATPAVAVVSVEATAPREPSASA
jgi:ligand-binding sensor domain-containing protein/signal transduction histidine kinase/CheY-like chemotaxis protein